MGPSGSMLKHWPRYRFSFLPENRSESSRDALLGRSDLRLPSAVHCDSSTFCSHPFSTALFRGDYRQ